MSNLMLKVDVTGVYSSKEELWTECVRLCRQINCDVEVNVGNYAHVTFYPQIPLDTMMRLADAQYKIECERSHERDKARFDAAVSRMQGRERSELNLIIARSAAVAGRLRQFEMRSSRDYQPDGAFAEFLTLQEHVETLYGMVQRVCAILLEEQK